MAVLFISDLHLDAKRPRAIKSFVQFIAAEAIRAEQLFILGDLFEVWIGDDDDDPDMEPAIAAIESMTDLATCAICRSRSTKNITVL